MPNIYTGKCAERLREKHTCTATSVGRKFARNFDLAPFGQGAGTYKQGPTIAPESQRTTTLPFLDEALEVDGTGFEAPVADMTRSDHA